MRMEILGAERHRRWDDEKKLSLVLSVGVDGATITDVARRHDVTRQQIYTWRSALKQKGLLLPSLKPVFLPVDMPVVQSKSGMADTTACLSAAVELQLRCGRSLRLDGNIDGVVLARLIRAVEAA